MSCSVPSCRRHERDDSDDEDDEDDKDDGDRSRRDSANVIAKRQSRRRTHNLSVFDPPPSVSITFTYRRVRSTYTAKVTVAATTLASFRVGDT